MANVTFVVVSIFTSVSSVTDLPLYAKLVLVLLTQLSEMLAAEIAELSKVSLSVEGLNAIDWLLVSVDQL